ncbi:putative mitochondrial protein [Trifolium repens]|nr:putative mitochondrial protein [Trifolium repens]
MLLSIALCHQPSLILINFSLFIVFSLIHPFDTNLFHTWWKINQFPSLIFLNSLHLLIHGLSPHHRFNCIFITTWIFICAKHGQIL